MSETKQRFDSFLSRIKAAIEGPPDEYYEELAKEDASLLDSLSDVELFQDVFFLASDNKFEKC